MSNRSFDHIDNIEVENPFERLILSVSTSILNEFKYDHLRDFEFLKEDLKTVEELEPSFIPKLAFYSRQHLNLRSVSNFILAWSATKTRTHPAFREFFTSVINLPSDLIEFVEQYQQEIGSPAKVKLTTFLQKLIAKKFREFNIYHLGMYCSDAKRKRELVKGSKKLSMKKLIIICHIKEPKLLVDSILRKKYPLTPESFMESGYGPKEKFDPELAGTRLKINTTLTWKTELSKKGNKAECWEELVKQDKLPYTAMLSNIKSILLTGVDNETHLKVVNKLKNPEDIKNAKFFPFKYLIAYERINIDLESLRKLKIDSNFEEKEQTNEHSSNDEPETLKKRKTIIPKEVPTQEILDMYKNSINDAIKLATSLNVDPIRGKTIIFCNISRSMNYMIHRGQKPNTYRSFRSIGFLFSLMLRSVSEDCEIYEFYINRIRSSDFCKVDLEGENIFELNEKMNMQADNTPQDNYYLANFPFLWFQETITCKKWIDNFIIFTDKMHPSHYYLQDFNVKYTNRFDIVNEYRDQVNPNMRYISCDLAGYSQKMEGENFEKDSKNLLIGGYSDSILQFISTSGLMQSEFVRNSKPMNKNSN